MKTEVDFTEDEILEIELTCFRRAIKNKVCWFCGSPAITFKDELSYTRYLLLGLCQECQDDGFKRRKNEERKEALRRSA